MELTQTKPRLPYVSFYKYAGNIAVPAIGTGLLIIVAARFSHSTESLNRLALASIILGIVVIGLSYYQNRRGLAQCEGKISDKDLSRLYRTASSMAMFGYAICMMALTIVRPF
jgi:hypothetical protein